MSTVKWLLNIATWENSFDIGMGLKPFESELWREWIEEN